MYYDPEYFSKDTRITSIRRIGTDTHSLVCDTLKVTLAIGAGNDPELLDLFHRSELLGFLRYTHGYPIRLCHNSTLLDGVDGPYAGYEEWRQEVHGARSKFYKRKMTDAEITDYVQFGMDRKKLMDDGE